MYVSMQNGSKQNAEK
uniref:Uncharacterized protein n=1 Tax=Arundo donax TaxID=35708 RepID=A0A0A9B540_ARUDO